MITIGSFLAFHHGPDAALKTETASKHRLSLNSSGRPKVESAPPPKAIDLGSKDSLLQTSNASRYLDDQTIAALNLTPEQVQRLNLIFEKARGAVCQRIADTGKFARSAQNVVGVDSQLSPADSGSLRDALYAGMQQVMGDEKFNDFTRMGQLTQFEAGFEFFGEFPTHYEFGGDGDSLASSEFIAIKSSFSRNDGGGTGVTANYTSFTGGKLMKPRFIDHYQALAEKILN